MVICQNCKSVHHYADTNVVYFSNTHTTYLCELCVDTNEKYLWVQADALRVCNECEGANEFNEWCFTCLSDKIFWSRLEKNKIGV
jgi:hypothetical protein